MRQSRPALLRPARRALHCERGIGHAEGQQARDVPWLAGPLQPARLEDDLDLGREAGMMRAKRVRKNGRDMPGLIFCGNVLCQGVSFRTSLRAIRLDAPADKSSRE